MSQHAGKVTTQPSRAPKTSTKSGYRPACYWTLYLTCQLAFGGLRYPGVRPFQDPVSHHCEDVLTASERMTPNHTSPPAPPNSYCPAVQITRGHRIIRGHPRTPLPLRRLH